MPRNTNAQPAPLPRAPDEGNIRQDIPQLVGTLYAKIPAAEQSRMLARMLRPLGLLSLAAVADGTFARLGYRGEQYLRSHIPPEDAHSLALSDIITLVKFVQQVSEETIEGVADALCSSPVLASSAVAALLLRVLLKRLKMRRTMSANANWVFQYRVSNMT